MSGPEAPQTRKKSRKWLWLLALVPVAGASAVMLSRYPEQPHTPAVVSTPDKPLGVGGRGRIEPEDGIMLVAAPYLNGRPSIMSDLRVKAGDWVRQGQVIGTIKGRDPLEKALRQDEAEVEVARTRLAQVKAGAKQSDIDEQRVKIARWESEYEIGVGDYRRYEKLRETGDVSAADLDQKRLIMERARREADAAKEALKSLEAIRQEDVEVRTAELAAAIARVDHARAELEELTVRAPATGRVLRIYSLPGEEVSSKGILELAKTDRMYVVAEVYETDIGRVRVGQKAVISGELLPEKLKGKVTIIEAQVSKSELLPLEPTSFADTRVIKVKILLENGERAAGLIYGKVDVVIEP